MFVFLFDMQTNQHYLPTAYIWASPICGTAQCHFDSRVDFPFYAINHIALSCPSPPFTGPVKLANSARRYAKKKTHSRLVPSLWGCCAAERAITLSISSHIILPAETHKHSDTNITESSLAPLKSISCHMNSNISTYEQKLSNLWVGQKSEKQVMSAITKNFQEMCEMSLGVKDCS